VFLNGEVLYSDSAQCLVKHTNEVGPQAKVLLTLVDRQRGQPRWQASNLRLAQDAKDFVGNRLQVRQQGQQLALVLNGSRQLGVTLLDLATGRVVWEYLPTE
jgi:outer membrane protein assembly factor BamB